MMQAQERAVAELPHSGQSQFSGVRDVLTLPLAAQSMGTVIQEKGRLGQQSLQMKYTIADGQEETLETAIKRAMALLFP